MASATPDLRLPSQLQSVTALWPVSNYTAWSQRHTGVSTACLRPLRGGAGQDSNPLPVNRKSDVLPAAPPHHIH